ncbi:MAG: lipocalin-like domain-containing protein [Pseudomonadota bacterium]
MIQQAMSRRRLLACLFVVVVVAITSLVWLLRPADRGSDSPTDAARPSTPSTGIPVTTWLAADPAGFERVTGPRTFVFPVDHGPHPTYQNEWWYFTGLLTDKSGKRFGYHVTFFRFGITAPGAPARESAWAAQSLYLAHFALTDLEAGVHHAFERQARGALDLAGAQSKPPAVWVGPWRFASGDDGATWFTLSAREARFALSLRLNAPTQYILQGDRGFSQKGPEPGQASYYYSAPRMASSGTLTFAGAEYTVAGETWWDREWGSATLAASQVGWDWFALRLHDGRSLMWYQLRAPSGEADGFGRGVLIADDGVRSFTAESMNLVATRHWTSPRTGATYPVGWTATLDSYPHVIAIDAMVDGQEIAHTVRYWEGAVIARNATTGEVLGEGYMELVGYQ